MAVVRGLNESGKQMEVVPLVVSRLLALAIQKRVPIGGKGVEAMDEELTPTQRRRSAG